MAPPSLSVAALGRTRAGPPLALLGALAEHEARLRKQKATPAPGLRFFRALFFDSGCQVPARVTWQSSGTGERSPRSLVFRLARERCETRLDSGCGTTRRAGRGGEQLARVHVLRRRRSSPATLPARSRKVRTAAPGSRVLEFRGRGSRARLARGSWRLGTDNDRSPRPIWTDVSACCLSAGHAHRLCTGSLRVGYGLRGS